MIRLFPQIISNYTEKDFAWKSLDRFPSPLLRPGTGREREGGGEVKNTNARAITNIRKRTPRLLSAQLKKQSQHLPGWHQQNTCSLGLQTAIAVWIGPQSPSDAR